MEDQQFILRWHYHETTLLKNLPRLLESEILTDITLSAGNQVVKAHRLVLATCSSYFLQLFQNVSSLQHPVIILHNTSIEDLKCLISFMYKGQCLITKKQLPSLLSLAKLLQIQGLCDMKLPEDTVASNRDDYLQDYKIQENQKSEEISEKSAIEELIFYNKYKNAKMFGELKPNANIYGASDFKNSCLAGSIHVLDNVLESLYSKPEKLFASETSMPKKSSRDLLYKCFLCGKYLSNQYNLRVHLETHEKGCYVCQSCPHVSRSRDALRKHVSYRHQEQYNIKKRKKLENMNI